MDKNSIDALNKEMYNLTLHHYQTPIQQEIILPLNNNISSNIPNQHRTVSAHSTEQIINNGINGLPPNIQILQKEIIVNYISKNIN